MFSFYGWWKETAAYCFALLFRLNTNKKCKNAALLCFKMHDNKLWCNYYDHDHSKHINDHLRCRQDNGATCLNCKVDFLLEMQTTALLLSPLLHHSPPFTFEMQAAWVGHSLVCPSPIHITCTHSRSFHLSLPFSRSFCESFTVPWYDQRQLCDTVQGIQEAENIKPLKSNLQKGQTQRDRDAHASVCMCVINKWIN